MGNKKDGREFDHRSLEDPQSIVAYLDAMARGFGAGRLLFCSGKQELVLKPGQLLNLSVKARRKEGRVKVSVDVSWKESDAPLEERPRLQILAGDEEEEE